MGRNPARAGVGGGKRCMAEKPRVESHSERHFLHPVSTISGGRQPNAAEDALIEPGAIVQKINICKKGQVSIKNNGEKITIEIT